MAIQFQEPNQNNVDMGDYLIVNAPNSAFPVLFAIIYEQTDKTILAKRYSAAGSKIREVKYEEAVVLKKDGTLLVGKEVKGNLEREIEGQERFR